MTILNPRVFNNLLSALAVFVVLVSSLAIASGDSGVHIPKSKNVSFTYTINDGENFRWDIQYDGHIGQGTNNAYGVGAYCRVNGSSINASGRGWANKAGDEIEIGPINRNNLKCYRRVRVYKTEGLARWLDIFENPTNNDIAVQISIYSYFNYGVSRMVSTSGAGAFGSKDWGFVTTPSNNSSNVPMVAQIVCGKRSKVRPTVSIRNNEVYVNYNLRIPARKTAILCYFHSQGRSRQALQTRMKKFKSYRHLRDLPAQVRKMIVNFPSTLDFANVELDRSDVSDSVTLANKDVILGTIVNESFSIDTRFGPMEIPANKVIGMVNTSAQDCGVLALLRDGQIISGQMGKTPLQMEIRSAGKLEIPASRLRQFSYRVSKDKPDEIAFKGPFVSLVTGDRLAFDPAKLSLGFYTRHGYMDLASSDLLAIRLLNQGHAVHRAMFLDGSTLGGFIQSSELKFTLALGPTADIPRNLIRQFEYAEDEKTDATLTHVVLSNGDELFGSLIQKKFTLVSEYGTVTVKPSDVRAMAFGRSRQGQTSVKLWNGTVLQGCLEEKTFSFKIKRGPSLALSPGQCISVLRSQEMPPDQIVKRVTQLVGLLVSESNIDRKKACAELKKFDKGIIPMLEKHLKKSRDGEVQSQLQTILDQMKADKTPTIPNPNIHYGGKMRW